MGWIIAILAISSVMVVLTIAELRRPIAASTVQLPELTLADRLIGLLVLGTFTVAVANGLILVAAKGLP